MVILYIMSKLYLKYEFDMDEDAYEYQTIVNARKNRALLHHIFNELRSKSKYCNEYTGVGSWQEAYDLIWELAKDEHVDPWEESF